MFIDEWNRALLIAASKAPVGRDTQYPLIVALQKVQSPSACEYTWVHSEPPVMPGDKDKLLDWIETIRQVVA